ncbi:MAG: protein O-GlcNAc transferase [Gammaproteobacteria bacterium]|nr:protein O-GlcNAc transferase [Gammaproteobacteria bacterium]
MQSRSCAASFVDANEVQRGVKSINGGGEIERHGIDLTPDMDLLETATEHHRAGKFVEARRLYRQVLDRAPAHALALFRSGLLELQDGHPAAALALVEQATAAVADEPRYQFVLGQALQALRRWDKAIAAYDAALSLQPDFLDAWNNLGICRQRCRQMPQAATAYRRALALEPGNGGVMANLGTVLREMGEFAAAAQLLRAAAELEPAVVSHAVNLGIVFWNQGNYSEAERILNQALARDPSDADAAFNLGNSLHGLGRSREAIARYRQAIDLFPEHADAFINLGNVHTEIGEFTEGMAAYDAALRVRPDSVVALNNAACLMRTLGRIDDAEATLDQALRLDPGNAVLHDTIGNVYKDAGDLDAAIGSFRKSLALDPASAATHSNLAYALSFQSPEAAPVLEECLRWSERFAGGLSLHTHDRAKQHEVNRRLKVGYVSADFRDHCQSLFTTPLLSRHDHSAFEIFCYASIKRPDDHTRRIAAYADVWRDVRALDDESLCRLIREDRIDILVDLTMHMAGGRPLLFARKPAPIQIAWLAYPGTTGIGAMDYRLSDPRLDPEGVDDHYCERTLRLPDSFWCYDPLTDHPGVNALPAIERGYLTLGCLNNPCKLTDHTLRLWGGVMRALPDSRLLLMAPPGRHRQRLSQRLVAQGIGIERVAFRAFQPRGEYLRSYHDIDLGLDTFPYNGHTTSLDSFWMGVPVITRVGSTSVGRGGLSQLFQLGLVELAADSDAAFIGIAAALGQDLVRLAALRRELRARLERSALMNAPVFARHMEHAYRDAWRAHCTRN